MPKKNETSPRSLREKTFFNLSITYLNNNELDLVIKMSSTYIRMRSTEANEILKYRDASDLKVVKPQSTKQLLNLV